MRNRGIIGVILEIENLRLPNQFVITLVENILWKAKTCLKKPQKEKSVSKAEEGDGKNIQERLSSNSISKVGIIPLNTRIPDFRVFS